MIDLRKALKKQHHAALAMLRQAVEICPDDLWLSGEHPRCVWRIAYHAAGYAHLYLYDNLDSWKPWTHARNSSAVLEGDVIEDEPYTRAQVLEFIDLIDREVDERIDAMDFKKAQCGYSWYPGVSQIELTILSLRHLHGHIGQLHELLIGRGLDVDWLGQPSS